MSALLTVLGLKVHSLYMASAVSFDLSCALLCPAPWGLEATFAAKRLEVMFVGGGGGALLTLTLNNGSIYASKQ